METTDNTANNQQAQPAPPVLQIENEALKVTVARQAELIGWLTNEVEWLTVELGKHVVQF